MQSKSPKVLLIDIETSPIRAFVWTMWDANVLKVLEPSKIMCAAWKFIGDKTTSCKSVSDYSSYKAGEVNDEELVKELWDVLDSADVVIGHNSDSFDIKKINTRFISHGLSAPSSYQTIDTLKIAKKYFKFESNSLDQLGKYLHEGQKEHTGGFSLWDNCIAGEKQSWTRMKKYNIQDVILLENIYLRLRPFITDHPNLSLIKNGATVEACPACMSKNISKRGFSYTKAGRKQRFQCTDCGSWSTGKWESVKAVSGDISGD